MSDTIDTLKQPESNLPDFDSFTDEQLDAVIIYLAKIARETHSQHGLSKEQCQVRYDKFFAILDSWPREFQNRVHARIWEAINKTQKAFWAAPADAIILATRAVELA